MNTQPLFPELDANQSIDLGTDAGAIRRYSIVRDTLKELIAARRAKKGIDTSPLSEAIADALAELDTMGASLLLELPSGTLIKLH